MMDDPTEPERDTLDEFEDLVDDQVNGESDEQDSDEQDSDEQDSDDEDEG